MDLRNNRFAAAFDELKRNHGIKTQKELAKRMGVNENTITRILKGYTEVTEDIITKLQTASGCIFNLQWLRGEDDTMLAKDMGMGQQPREPAIIDSSSALNAAISAYVVAIDAKDAQIAQLNDQLKDKNKIIEQLEARIAELKHAIAQYSSADREHYPFPVGTAEDKKQRKTL
jgi:plasmid maintenance system antidote protein VapI